VAAFLFSASASRVRQGAALRGSPPLHRPLAQAARHGVETRLAPKAQVSFDRPEQPEIRVGERFGEACVEAPSPINHQ
ncbi:MAG TPA: hypothetical protein PLZ95_15900, partial [Bryobacteraceae bacterium]|nr:hypothetical protein [Bryobacteraceae bacterium]